MIEVEKAPPRIVWSPLPGSQLFAVACPCHHIFYEGTRGPGKTDAQLMAFRKRVGQGYGRFWRGVIFDREYKNLDDLVAKSQKWFREFGDGAEFLKSAKDYKWVWPTGEELLFRAVQKEADYWDYHGQEFAFIGWNELTKYPDAKLYDAMMSCNRTSFVPEEHSPDKAKPLPPIPLVVFSTSNPYGPGHNWVKRRFVDVGQPGQVIRTTTNVFNPRTQKREDVVKTQVRIFGSYKENRYLSPEYIAELEKITEPNKRRAWLWGDWDIVAGGAIDDLWNQAVHVIPRFPIPASWYVDRSFDWGSSKPFSVGWWAEATGEEIELPDGKVFCPVRGSVIRFWEYYGCNANEPNTGLKMASTDVAEEIKRIEEKLVTDKWVTELPWPGPADNSIRNVEDKGSDSIETKMSRVGVDWTASDKRPGSRKNGLELLRDRLQASLKHAEGKDDAGPGIYFMVVCKHAIATLPVLPRDDKDPDDVDTDAEDHIYDDTRYRVLSSGNRFTGSLKINLPR